MKIHEKLVCKRQTNSTCWIKDQNSEKNFNKLLLCPLPTKTSDKFALQIHYLTFHNDRIRVKIDPGASPLNFFLVEMFNSNLKLPHCSCLGLCLLPKQNRSSFTWVWVCS